MEAEEPERGIRRRLEHRDHSGAATLAPAERWRPRAILVAVFDVFLSHNSKDKPAVELLASKLVSEAGLEPYRGLYRYDHESCVTSFRGHQLV